jgi:hypothetical protein
MDAKLEALDLQTVLTICVELLTICARRSVEIDPAVAAMIAYARDEIVTTGNHRSPEMSGISSPARTA